MSDGTPDTEDYRSWPWWEWVTVVAFILTIIWTPLWLGGVVPHPVELLPW